MCTIHLIQPDTPSLTEPLSFPSLGLLYISSFLKELGYEVEIDDLTGGTNFNKSFDSDIIGFTCQTVHYKNVLNMFRYLKEKMDGSSFVIGGPHPTWFREDCIGDGFDAAICGEGELEISNFLSKINRTNSHPNSVKNSDVVLNIDTLLPDWEAININRYRYFLDDRKCMNIMTSRGNCPFGKSGHCTFCPKTSTHSKLRFRSVKSVLNEAKLLRDIYGCGSLAIYDDNVLINKKRDYKIFNGLKELDIRFRCMTRANLASRTDLQLLKDCGCAEICLGAESGDSFILEKIIKKGTTVDLNTKFMNNCKDVGLRVKAYLMIGLPSESEKSIQNTIRWLRMIDPDNYDISVFTPYKGSEIYDNKEQFEIEWDENELRDLWFNGITQFGESGVSTPGLSAERIQELRDTILNEFPRGNGGTTSYWGPKDSTCQ